MELFNYAMYGDSGGSDKFADRRFRGETRGRAAAAAMPRVFPHLQIHQRPFASDFDEEPQGVPDSLAKKWAEERVHSTIVLGGPEQVSAADIFAEQQEHVRRNPHAGRSNRSSMAELVRQDLPWQPTSVSGVPQPTGGGGRAAPPRAARSTVQLTDEMPEGTGRPPPDGYFYNANGALQLRPVHAEAAARSHMIPTYFGAADVGPPEPQPNNGRARVEHNWAERADDRQVAMGRAGLHRSLGPTSEALIYGDGDAPPSAASPDARGGRRHIVGHASHVSDHLTWSEEGERRHHAGGRGRGGRALLASLSDSHLPPAAHRVGQPSLSGARPSGAAQLGDGEAYRPGQAPLAPPGHRGSELQLHYDQERRAWVGHDGMPTGADPLLGRRWQQPTAWEGGGLHAGSTQYATSTSHARPPMLGQPPLPRRFAPPTDGLRHPRLWKPAGLDDNVPRHLIRFGRRS